jgi:tetratricopeptide (TPR) repeat protein
MRTADLLADARRKDEALHRYDLAREVYNSLYAPDASREVAHVLSRQGDLYRQTGEAARALDKYREAVQVEERAATSKPDALLRRNIDSLEVRPSLPLEQQRQRIDQR